VTVVRFPLRMPAELAASARAELLDRGREPAGAAFRFGYLLGVELDELPELPALARLHGLLRERVVEPGYELSFFKTTVGQAPEAEEGVHFDGFHLDTHPDIRSYSDGFELARLLVNLAPTAPRSATPRSTGSSWPGWGCGCRGRTGVLRERRAPRRRGRGGRPLPGQLRGGPLPELTRLRSVAFPPL
jgi:hypothetical protein